MWGRSLPPPLGKDNLIDREIVDGDTMEPSGIKSRHFDRRNHERENGFKFTQLQHYY